MDNDDDLSNISSPNHFLLSTYKENLSLNETTINDSSEPKYKCHLCRKAFKDPILTCSNCVNKGEFCSSKHATCSHKQREDLFNLLNEKYFNDQSLHFL